jgi:hypothetical protein
MGLANSPSAFSRIMSPVLRGLQCETCLNYVDDTNIMSTDFSQDVQRLGAVLDKFRKAGLLLKPSKCRLFQLQDTFLGHVVSAGKNSVDPDKMAVISGLQPPRNIKELRSMLGFCNYYRNFCPNFADIVVPLLQLLKKGVVFEWKESRQRAFTTLEAILTSPPVLGIIQDEGDLVLDVNESLFLAAAVLQQYQEDGQIL